jgi:hypothetical protein
MKTHTIEKYSEKKDESGYEYLCPIIDEQADNVTPDVPGDDCFEKDVFERYAGNIGIADKDN